MKRAKVRPGRGKELKPRPRNTKSRQPTPCRHCDLPGRRPKGLCWRCFNTPEINEQYRSTSKYCRRGVSEHGSGEFGEPTSALPGTEDKIRVLEDRAALGLALFHPADARSGVSDETERRMRALGLLRGSNDTYEDDEQ